MMNDGTYERGYDSYLPNEGAWKRPEAEEKRAISMLRMGKRQMLRPADEYGLYAPMAEKKAVSHIRLGRKRSYAETPMSGTPSFK